MGYSYFLKGLFDLANTFASQIKVGRICSLFLVGGGMMSAQAMNNQVADRANVSALQGDLVTIKIDAPKSASTDKVNKNVDQISKDAPKKAIRTVSLQKTPNATKNKDTPQYSDTDKKIPLKSAVQAQPIIPELGLSSTPKQEKSAVSIPPSAAANQSSPIPTSTNSSSDKAALPTLQFAPNNRVKVAVGPSASSINYDDARTIGRINTGLGYYQTNGNSTNFGVHADAATMLGSNFAIGSNLSFYPQKKDVGLNGVWRIGETGVHLKAASSYSWGEQEFDFSSGKQTLGLSQAAYYLSGHYAVPQKTAAWLHSVGISAWGARAYQSSHNIAPVSYVVENADNYRLLEDTFKLATGRLIGTALDTQIALRSNLVGKLSLGVEQLKFPFANGTQEKTTTGYYDLAMYYEPISDLLLSLAYKNGASETRTTIAAESHGLKVSAFQNRGQNGLDSNKGLLLSYNFLNNKARSSDTLAQRMRPQATLDNSQLLNNAATRPTQIPNVFLAKVDTTAVGQLFKVDKKSLPPGTSVDSQGNLLIPVGSKKLDGARLGSTATDKDPIYDYTNTVSIVNANLVVRLKNLSTPAIGAQNIYTFYLSDSQKKKWRIQMTNRR